MMKHLTSIACGTPDFPMRCCVTTTSYLGGNPELRPREAKGRTAQILKVTAAASAPYSL